MDLGNTPFFVTVLLAVLGWSITHEAERISSSPTIEWRSQVYKDGKNGTIFEVRLINLTRAVSFRDISLMIKAPPGGKITDFQIQPVEPGFEGNEPAHVMDASARFELSEIQPGESFFARAAYQGSTPPSIQLTLPKGAARFVKPSLETVVAKNEFLALLIVIAAGVVCLAIYAIARLLRRRVDQPALSKVFIFNISNAGGN